MFFSLSVSNGYATKKHLMLHNISACIDIMFHHYATYPSQKVYVTKIEEYIKHYTFTYIHIV